MYVWEIYTKEGFQGTKYVLQEIKRAKHVKILLKQKQKFLRNLEFLGREKSFTAFKGNVFPVKVIFDHGREKRSWTLSTSSKISITNPTKEKIKISTPKQMLQRLLIALAQVKAVITSKTH